jgi:hypothetical protein
MSPDKNNHDADDEDTPTTARERKPIIDKLNQLGFDGTKKGNSHILFPIY